MELKAQGILYKVAFFNFWGEADIFFGEWPLPEKIETSICELFWSILLNIVLILVAYCLNVILAVFIALVCLGVGVILILIFSAVFIISGYVPNFKGQCDHDIIRPIESWPTIASCRIWPIWPLSAVGITWLAAKYAGTAWHYLGEQVQDVTSRISIGYGSLRLLTILAFVFAFLIIGFGLRRFFRSNTWKVAAAFIRSKKEGVCIKVKFAP